MELQVDKDYKVIISKDILKKIDSFLNNLNLNFNKILVITDENVNKFYGNILKNNLINLKNTKVDFLVFPSGEKTKSVENFLKGIDFLGKNKYKRDDLIIAFGGGVIGDLAGFISATYQRGMNLVMIPTTLLSSIDSSVGGKTAVNLDYGKNLLGSFKKPLEVYCDYSLFKTMEDKFFLDGVSETIKYSILTGENLKNGVSLFKSLKNPIKKDDERLEEIISKSLLYKGELVKKDEFDLGERRLLNLGHTIGHSIEKISKYNISHGHGVAIGICKIANISYNLGYIDNNLREDIIKIIKLNNLETTTDYSYENIYENSIMDKKSSKDSIEIVLIKGIGKCFLKRVSFSKWKEYLKNA